MNMQNVSHKGMPTPPPAGQALEKENPFKHNRIETKEEKQKNNKIKVLIYADSPTVNTGFGVVTKNILRRLYDTGKYEFNVWGINYVGIPYDHEEFPYNIYPAALSQTGDLYGRQQFLDFMMNTEFDILWCLNDPFIISTFLSEAVVAFRREAPEKIFQWIFYFPIDTPHFKKSWVVPIMTADFPVCYNSWTYKKLIEAAPELKKKLKTVYHGIDEKTFYPLPEEEIKAFKKDYWRDWIKEDTFLIVNVNRNQQRKDFYRTLKAFKLFKKKHPNSHLYMHCKIDDMGGNLLEMAAQVGLKAREDFSYPDPKRFHPAMGLPIEVLNQIYNAADVVVSTTLGEGCGLSAYEAMATKTAIVMPDNTALIETMAEGRGMPVKCGVNDNMFTVIPMDNSIIRPLVDVYDMAKKLDKMAKDKNLRQKIAQRGYEWIMTKKWDSVCEEWVEIFEKASNKIRQQRAGIIMPTDDIDGGIAGVSGS